MKKFTHLPLWNNLYANGKVGNTGSLLNSFNTENQKLYPINDVSSIDLNVKENLFARLSDDTNT